MGSNYIGQPVNIGRKFSLEKAFLANHASFLYFFIVRKNMQSILATRLKDVTFELRKMEKDHYMKV